MPHLRPRKAWPARSASSAAYCICLAVSCGACQFDIETDFGLGSTAPSTAAVVRASPGCLYPSCAASACGCRNRAQFWRDARMSHCACALKQKPKTAAAASLVGAQGAQVPTAESTNLQVAKGTK